MQDIQICSRCKDEGYLIGYKRDLNNPNVQMQWKEVCPYCMPTNKYGNLQKILENAPKLLGLDKDPPEER